MKKNVMGEMMAKAVLNVSKWSANKRCICLYHKPKMPKEVMLLRKTGNEKD